MGTSESSPAGWVRPSAVRLMAVEGSAASGHTGVVGALEPRAVDGLDPGLEAGLGAEPFHDVPDAPLDGAL